MQSGKVEKLSNYSLMEYKTNERSNKIIIACLVSSPQELKLAEKIKERLSLLGIDLLVEEGFVWGSLPTKRLQNRRWEVLNEIDDSFTYYSTIDPDDSLDLEEFEKDILLLSEYDTVVLKEVHPTHSNHCCKFITRLDLAKEVGSCHSDVMFLKGLKDRGSYILSDNNSYIVGEINQNSMSRRSFKQEAKCH